MDFLISAAYAQTAAPGPQSTLMQLLPIVVLFVAFYFLLIRPQTKKAKEHRDMVAKLAVGDEVVTSGGILGRVTEAGETFVTVEIARDVAIKVQRVQISQLMPKGTFKNA
ncbi:MAG: preprotein translocase subunit YajC [Proteobacteria bacterium]|nr:preprotein translocase subunit YajC [Pseudomonadota bacterium]